MTPIKLEQKYFDALEAASNVLVIQRHGDAIRELPALLRTMQAGNVACKKLLLECQETLEHCRYSEIPLARKVAKFLSDTPQAAEREGYTLVPVDPTPAMLDVAVSFGLNVSISSEFGWSEYMETIYRRMLMAVPTGKGGE